MDTIKINFMKWNNTVFKDSNSVKAFDAISNARQVIAMIDIMQKIVSGGKISSYDLRVTAAINAAVISPKTNQRISVKYK